MKKRSFQQIWPAVLFFCMLLACILASAFFLYSESRKTQIGAPPGLRTLVIDPGHGGIDGGAISDNGTKESDINLAVGLKLRDLAELVGQPVLMTRSDDSSRTSYADYSEHEDLVHRTELINETPGAVLISIHQNDFPTGQPSGAQVLFAASAGSEKLGKRTHQNLISLLDPQNRRVAEPAPKALYITSNVNCPAILVECGFMSNNFEVEKLRSAGYQCSLALVLAGSFLQVLSENDIV